MKNRKVTTELSAREVWACWRAVIQHHQPPFIHALKYKLYALISDKERRRFQKLYEEETGRLKTE
jgi:hypothetical protein